MENSTRRIGYYVNLIWETRDKRMDNWPLMDSLTPTLILSAMYLFTTLILGPLMMKNKKPYSIRVLIILYNIIITFVNFYMCQQIWVWGWRNNYNILCAPLDRSKTPTTEKIAFIYYMYYIVKYLDWTDSFFFLLRKKYGNLNLLHVYHHFVAPSMSWVNTRFSPGGQTSSLILLNSGVHVVMHTYYTIAALGPEYQKYLWWKKYLTMLQIIQLVLISLHGILPSFLTNCHLGYPHELGYYYIFQVVVIFFMFIRFYVQSYTPSKQSNGTVKVKST